MAQLNRRTLVLLVPLLIGVAELAWAVILPSSSCVRISIDYGSCSDNSALKWEVGIIGVILIIVPLVSYAWMRRRRHPHAEGLPEVIGNTASGFGGQFSSGGPAGVTPNTLGSCGGIYDPSSLLSACDNTGLDEWIGAISPNDPDDPPTPTPITC